MEERRADARLNEERILLAAARLLERAPAASLAEVAVAAGVSRSTLYRHFSNREALIARLEEEPVREPPETRESPQPAGRLGRRRPLALDAIHVFDAVPAALLPEQLVAEAGRIADVPVALYVIDIDGSRLLRMGGADRLGDELEAPLTIGPELDAEGVSQVREWLAGTAPGVELYPLWLRGRAVGAFLTFGRPREPLTEIARQAAAAVTLADRYTDAFARVQRRKQPRAAAEIQQSLLPPRIARVGGGEVAGNVLPSYEVAGDWFDVAENSHGIWLTIADGLGGSTRAAASSAVALGALRASRRSGGSPTEALLLMHATLREMPGPRAEMTALVCHWDPVTTRLTVFNCGHEPPLLIRADGASERMRSGGPRGLGGRARPRPGEDSTRLASGDRLILLSDGVTGSGPGQAGLGQDALFAAALGADALSASDTVRRIHAAVLEACEEGLRDDATAVCLLAG